MYNLMNKVGSYSGAMCVFGFVLLLGYSFVALAGKPKAQICHHADANTVSIIEVAKSAVPAHFKNHNDYFPNEEICGSGFDENCNGVKDEEPCIEENCPCWNARGAILLDTSQYAGLNFSEVCGSPYPSWELTGSISSNIELEGEEPIDDPLLEDGPPDLPNTTTDPERAIWVTPTGCNLQVVGLTSATPSCQVDDDGSGGGAPASEQAVITADQGARCGVVLCRLTGLNDCMSLPSDN